jgi:tether containing UBX domain for GLUT4
MVLSMLQDHPTLSTILTANRYKGKSIDLTQTFRQTGLAPGSRLEMIAGSKSPSAVSIALQLPESLASAAPPSGRLTDTVPSNTTLWRILRKFESDEGRNLNFTGRGVTEIENGASGAGRIYYEMPVINVGGREMSTFGHLQKTLQQIGINDGRSLLKLSFRKTNQPLEEAMKEIGEYFKEEEEPAAVEKKAATESATQDGIEPITNAIARLPESAGDAHMTGTPEPISTESTPSSELLVDEIISSTPATQSNAQASQDQQTVLGPGERPISVFSAPSGATPRAALQPHNENDYEPTIAHAKLHQNRLQTSSQNRRLLSDVETERLEKEKAAKLAAMTSVSIKIRFPDQSTTQATFNASETGADLYTLVRDVIIAEDQAFKLVYTNRGPQTVPNDPKKKLIKDLGFSGRVLVNFHWDENATTSARQGPVLKPQYAEKAQEVKVPEVAADVAKGEDGPSTEDKGKGKETGSGGSSKGKGGMPKWFKGLGKK